MGRREGASGAGLRLQATEGTPGGTGGAARGWRRPVKRRRMEGC